MFASLGPAQTTQFGPPQVITTMAGGARSVFAADLDGDGDQDVLSASLSDSKIAWYENTDGMGAFGAQQVITTSVIGPWSVYAADLDGDGDFDVLSASFFDRKIAWYENTDGLGSFGAQQVITTSANGAFSVFAADLDGDGDQDVLSASENDNKIAWYENTDGMGAFGPQQVITTSANNASSVFAADLDGDGDQDVLSASFFDDKIAWYENTDGMGAFGPQQVITTSAIGAISAFAADLDGDGDQDVLSASQNDSKIAWYENTDGMGAFGPQQVITSSAFTARSVFAADLDGDGDQDVLSAALLDNKIAWYENTDAMGAFGPQHAITTSADQAISVFAADLDGDGDWDVLSASANDDKIAWYENLGATPFIREIDVVPTSIAYGDQDVDAGATAGAAVTITNIGTAALGFLGAQVALAGADAAEFTITGDTGEASLAPGASRTVNVAFNPATFGAKSASLTITSDDADEGTVNVVLTGVGIDQEIDVAPTSIAYGARSIEAIPTDAAPVSIENIGNEILNFTGAQVALTGTDAAEFLIVNDTGEATLAPGAVRTVGVAFDPSTLGVKTADLTITSDDSDEPEVNVALAGEGQPPPPVVPTIGPWGRMIVTLILLCGGAVVVRRRIVT